MARILIHGGAGDFSSQQLANEDQYRQTLQRCLQSGFALLCQGEESAKIAAHCVSLLENSPLFNAGVGSVLNAAGVVQCDAAIMQGKTVKAGAILASENLKNPVLGALAAINHKKHLVFSGDSILKLAEKADLELVENQHLVTPERIKQFERASKGERIVLDHDKLGTVGAVVLDQKGNLSAATSTGGTIHKEPGRISDSCLIGAGTYANDQVAVSCTGEGEYFIRAVAAYRLAAQYGVLGDVVQAASLVLDYISKLGGRGGLIAIDNNGKYAMPFNTAAMFRGVVDESLLKVEIFS